jgi:hypothetical protein
MPSSHDGLPEQFEKAKGKVEASGWRVDSISGDPAKIDALYLYAFDYETKWTWCCTLSRDKFDEIIQGANLFSKSELSALVAEMMRICSKEKEIDPLMVNTLAGALAMYIVRTQTYEKTQGGRTHVHFIVIRYGKIKKVRPMAAAGELHQINSAARTVQAIANTIETDKKNHPEWF